MRAVVIAGIFLSAVVLGAPPANWYGRVEPIMTAEEKKLYRSLDEKERPAFEEKFWATRQITQDDYLRRVQYVDDTFGSGRAGSGANTDQGRVYLAIGPPNRLTRLPSSRTFFPIEIWYYSEAPGLDIHYELQLLFFRPGETGDYKLYSPSLNTIRELMNPQAGTRGTFGVNDVITESDVRTKLTLSPTEDEVITAAVSVARGITGVGNDEILAMVASPSYALSRAARTRVTSRLMTAHPPLLTFQTVSREGTPQVDLLLRTALKKTVKLEVLYDAATVFQQETNLALQSETEVAYQQRLDLLPGKYTLLFTVDGKQFPYPLSVEDVQLSELVMADSVGEANGKTPFSFDAGRIDPDDRGTIAVIYSGSPRTLTWRLRQGLSTLWLKRTTAGGVIIENLDEARLAPGEYELEVASDSGSRTRRVRLGDKKKASNETVISQNANLQPVERLRLLARQYVMRSDLRRARELLGEGLRLGLTDGVETDLSRIDALTGRYDDARERLRGVLSRSPGNFEALTVLAYVETQLQDYVVAAKLYRQALAIQASPAVEQALARLPR